MINWTIEDNIQSTNSHKHYIDDDDDDNDVNFYYTDNLVAIGIS